VKNGSNARVTTSGGIPLPVSEIDSRAYWPGKSPYAMQSSDERLISSVSMASLPPRGMASRALMAG
jgi:hypothetical protein